ncbi:hypothetical protein DF047_36965 [Burkholderia cenocepacia]|nr:hypothetical protein DF047_36965 [Burkholderia cenocepacia]
MARESDGFIYPKRRTVYGRDFSSSGLTATSAANLSSQLMVGSFEHRVRPRFGLDLGIRSRALFSDEDFIEPGKP